jgi:hypothetical protein
MLVLAALHEDLSESNSQIAMLIPKFGTPRT